MRVWYSLVSIILVFVCMMRANGQEIRRAEVGIDFRVNRVVLDTTYMNNAQRIQEIVDFVNFLQSERPYELQSVSFYGSASPEGSYQQNLRLARARLRTLEQWIRSRVEIPDSLITREETYIRWEFLKYEVAKSDLPQKEELLRILEEEAALVPYYNNQQIDERILKIRQLGGGETWKELNRRYFANMREAFVVFEMRREEIRRQQTAVAPVQVQHAVPSNIIRPANTLRQSAMDMYQPAWYRNWYVNTNVLALGMGITSLGVEYDFAKHWSVAVPLLYSGWNYFIETIKFRTFAVQPEVRYWFNENHTNWFVGAHASLAYYNVAVDGGYRYQDHAAESPAWGGGLSGGYRLPLTRDQRLSLDFSLGLGVYPLHYDIFDNTTNTADGLLIQTARKTYFGIDQVAVTLSYSFNNQKGGTR